jgi:hypothetical protein
LNKKTHENLTSVKRKILNRLLTFSSPSSTSTRANQFPRGFLQQLGGAFSPVASLAHGESTFQNFCPRAFTDLFDLRTAEKKLWACRKTSIDFIDFSPERKIFTQFLI